MSARRRGFIADRRPRAGTRELLDRVNQVLAEYADPLTLRRIFYRLVGVHDYDKTELAHGRLGEILNKARHGRLVPMDATRDDGFTSAVPSFFMGEDDFVDAVGAAAQNLRLDRQRGQPSRLAQRCEASGMVPQLQRVTDPFGVAVYSGGGFNSLTDKHRIGKEWAEPVTVLHFGDHDPSLIGHGFRRRARHARSACRCTGPARGRRSSRERRNERPAALGTGTHPR